jgi:2-alkyl-3-oxoalkanoate reductase
VRVRREDLLACVAGTHPASQLPCAIRELVGRARYQCLMRILVTGGSGFMASALCRALARRGDQVVTLSRQPALAALRINSKGVSIVEGSIGDPQEVARAAQGAELVFHAAGIAALDAPTRVLRWVHIAGTENVLRAARHVGVRRVVYTSCADVSLSDEDRMHWDEQRALPRAPIGPHARTKLTAEELALAASDERLQVTALRPAMLWGPDDVDGLAAFLQAARAGTFTLYGGGRNIIATTHIDNFVRAALLAASAEAAPGRAYYVTDGEFLEAREFYERLARALGLAPPKLGGSLALALARARISDLLHASEGAARAAVVRIGRSALFDVSRATLDLGFEAKVDLDARFSELTAWIDALGGVDRLRERARPKPVAADVEAQVQAAGGD